MRKKCLLIGNESDYQKWFREIPAIKDYVSGFISENDVKHFYAEDILLVARNVSRCNAEKILKIDDFVSELLTTSEILPRKLRVEASTLCQLNCAECYMRLHQNGILGQGYLKFEDFKKLVDENPIVNEIELSNSGEIFLNPELSEIMKYSFQKNIRLTARNGVNFNNVSDEQLESLVKYQFASLFISLDGVTQESYAKYRVNGNLQNVICNIRKLNAIKERLHSEYPHLTFQFIIMEHNENDVPFVKSLAEQLNMNVSFKLTWNSDYKPKNRKMLQRETGLSALSRKEYNQISDSPYFGFYKCAQMFLSPQINWDGRLLGCCSIFQYDFGVNVFEIGLKKALKSEIYLRNKKFLVSNDIHVLNGVVTPCISCSNRKNLLEKGISFTPLSGLYLDKKL